MRGEEPAPLEPIEISVEPGTNLADVLLEAGDGSVLTLLAGAYDVSELLVIDRRIKIAG
jgi:hypothetical protein